MKASIVVSCYQERDFIRGCLDSVLAFELPPDTEIEILVIDGMSTDGTREIVAEYAARDPRITLVDNPERYQAQAMNLGIRRARGEYILWIAVHSVFPKEYLRLCIETARRTGAELVGGQCTTLQRGSGYQASLVQALTTHKFGVGDSGFRVGATEGPVDTVPYGCFRADVFERVGLFDERLVRAQDYEMNRRIGHMGGKVWMNPDIRAMYYQQPTMIAFLRKQLEKEAPYNAYLWYVAPYAFTPRHAVSGVFAAGVILGAILSWFTPWIAYPFIAVMGLYALLAVLSSVQQAIRYRKPAHVLVLPFCFFGYHFLHGVGLLHGLVRLATRTAPVMTASRGKGGVLASGPGTA